MGNELNCPKDNYEKEQATGAQVLDTATDSNSPSSQYTMTIGSQKMAITSSAFTGRIIPEIDFGNPLNS